MNWYDPDVKNNAWKVSFIIPCYNERGTIARIIDRVQSVDFPLELVVVDDGSSDGSRDLLKGELAAKIDRLILHEKNRGKGAALRSGFAAATGDFVIVQDADLEYDPADVRLLLEPLLKGEADAVYGSRFLRPESRKTFFLRQYLANRVLTFLSNVFTGLRLTDMETCYKLFAREHIQSFPLQEDRFGFEPEVTALAARRGLRIREVGVSYAGRGYAEGKKIGAKDAWRALYCILKYGLFPGR